MKNILQRFRSPVAIGALLALIAFVAKNWFNFEIPGWDEFVELLVVALIAFGIVNNPADRARF